MSRGTPLLLLALAGCAHFPTPEPPWEDYACAGGAGFRLARGDSSATLDIDGMRFALQPEPASTGTRSYSCSMLRLTIDTDAARIEMEGQPHLEQCRPRRGGQTEQARPAGRRT